MNDSDGVTPTRSGLPRWLSLVLTAWATLVGAPLMHGALPNALSSLAPRRGWARGRPGAWNLLGLIPIAAGCALLAWSGALHVRSMPARVELRPTPNYLVRRGPYAFTRNPMWLGGLALWLGWAIFYGSWPVLGGAGLWAAVTHFLFIPHEERVLEAQFGEEYQRYRESVRRWV